MPPPQTLFTSDTHFSHAKAITHCNRPFTDIQHMEEELVKRWNEVVTPRDTVYHLGDFGYVKRSECARILSRLNGHKHLCPGNHDSKAITGTTEAAGFKGGWESVQPYREVKVIPGEPKVILHHYALRVWRSSHHAALHLYGHSHGNLPGDTQSCDVGVDCFNYYPVTTDQIKARMATHAPRVHPDHHQPRMDGDMDDDGTQEDM